MAFRPRVAEPPPPGAASSPPRAAQPCGGLGRLLARLFREGKPEILMLGPLCGESAVYLAGRGARVHVDDFEPPAPHPPRRPGEAPVESPPVRLDLPDGRFDLVLAWELFDFVPPDRLAEVGGEIARVLRFGGHLFLFSHQKPPTESAVIPRYRVYADDLIAREEPEARPRRRWAHPNREIERGLHGLAVQGIHLQRNQMREILASKVGVG